MEKENVRSIDFWSFKEKSLPSPEVTRYQGMFKGMFKAKVCKNGSDHDWFENGRQLRSSAGISCLRYFRKCQNSGKKSVIFEMIGYKVSVISYGVTLITFL